MLMGTGRAGPTPVAESGDGRAPRTGRGRRVAAGIVAILLITLAARSAQHGSIVVTAVYGDGRPVSSAFVTLPGTTIGALTDIDGRATLSSVLQGSHIVRLRRIGCPPADRAVTVVAGATSNVDFVVDCGDRIKTDAPTTDLIGLLDHGADVTGSATCENDIAPPLQGTGTLTLPGNATPDDAGGVACHLGVLLLSPDRAPFYANTPALVPWTAGINDVVNVTLPTSRLALPVRVVIAIPGLASAEETLLRSRIALHLATAQLVMDDSRAGIGLVDDANPASPPQVDLAAAAAPLLSGGCGAAAAIRASPSVYAAGRLNIYYLADVFDEVGGEKAGYSCGTSDAPEIILMDADHQFINTLAHEIGHSLGLVRPDWGHAEEYAGLYRTSDSQQQNIMANGTPADVQYFTVGQVAQFHLSAASWLNRQSVVGTSLRERLAVPGADVRAPCACPESAATADCPAAVTDIPRDGVRIENAAIKACTVTLSTASVVICRGATVEVSGTFSQGGTPTTRGNRMWVSLAPGIVTAADASVAYPANDLMTGRLTGVSVGTATVRAYVDGSFSPIAVEVKAPGSAPC